MKFDRLPVAEPRPGDSAAMLRAIEELKRLGLDVRRPNGSPYQLKVSADLSFYPNKGTIFRDGDQQALPQRGIASLLEVLGEFVLQP